jgi:DNA mismatch repair ATPase MutS
LTATGLSICYPTVSVSKAVHASDIFDLALAGKLVSDHAEVITNDFALTDDERVIVVTGANQGGKTTFSRTFGQLHFLAALGLPVPGSEAALFLFDHLFTHYEKEEDVHTLHGKLEDELVRIHDILARATSDSIIIMNEIFTSTTLEDAIVLGTAIMNQIIERDILCVCVTFVDELSILSDTTLSLVAAVDPAEPASRTFKLVPKPADGLAYAAAIADKYGLSYERMKERIAS